MSDDALGDAIGAAVTDAIFDAEGEFIAVVHPGCPVCDAERYRRADAHADCDPGACRELNRS
jgi:hypothetical protein